MKADITFRYTKLGINYDTNLVKTLLVSINQHLLSIYLHLENNPNFLETGKIYTGTVDFYTLEPENYAEAFQGNLTEYKTVIIEGKNIVGEAHLQNLRQQ